MLHDGFSFFLFDGFEQDRDAVHMFLGPLYDLTDNVFAVEDVAILSVAGIFQLMHSCFLESLQFSIV